MSPGAHGAGGDPHRPLTAEFPHVQAGSPVRFKRIQVTGIHLDLSLIHIYTSMTLEHGTLEITGGSVINAASFSITNGDAVLRPGTCLLYTSAVLP